MKRLALLFMLLSLMIIISSQASTPGLLENYQSENVVLQNNQYSLDDDYAPIILDPFTYGLATAMNIYGVAFGLNLFTGKNKFDNSNNSKKDADIGMNTTLYYQRMLCSAFAIGALLSYDT